MSELLLDRAGRRRSPATMPGFHAGRSPANKGLSYPADPPRVEEVIAHARQPAHVAPPLRPVRERVAGSDRHRAARSPAGRVGGESCGSAGAGRGAGSAWIVPALFGTIRARAPTEADAPCRERAGPRPAPTERAARARARPAGRGGGRGSASDSREAHLRAPGPTASRTRRRAQLTPAVIRPPDVRAARGTGRCAASSSSRATSARCGSGSNAVAISPTTAPATM
jgi:hypothetical protein